MQGEGNRGDLRGLDFQHNQQLALILHCLSPRSPRGPVTLQGCKVAFSFDALGSGLVNL